MALYVKERSISNLKNEKSKVQFKISDFVIPIFGLIVLILLTIFVYIPAISDAMDMRTELADLKEKKAHLDELAVELESQNMDTYNSDYNSLSLILPKKLEVANFAYYIDKLAVDKNLALTEIRLGNSSVTNIKKSDTNEGEQVSGPVKYNGDYDSIISFMDEMQSYSPYLISLESLKLSHMPTSVSNNSWSLELSVMATYYGNDTITIPSYSNYMFVPYTTNADSLSLLKKRSEKILQTNTGQK
jgi:Tfp pilus assembly protein PilO